MITMPYPINQPTRIATQNIAGRQTTINLTTVSAKPLVLQKACIEYIKRLSSHITLEDVTILELLFIKP